MTQLIYNFESRINLSLTKLVTDATKPLLDKVDALEDKVALYEAHFKELDERIEDLEYRCEIKWTILSNTVVIPALHFTAYPSQKVVKNHHPNAYLKPNKFVKMSSSYQSLMTGPIEFIGLAKSKITRTVKIHHKPPY